MKILVTGGAGFIGSHLCERLIAEGHEVIALDDLSTGKKAFLAPLAEHPNFTFVHGSGLDRSLLNEVMEGCEAVFHLAAVLGVKNTVENPLKVIEGNIDVTRNVLELAFPRKIKVIFSSTSEVYGKNELLPFHENSSRVLGPTTKNRWCYATAKALDEHMCFAYADKGLPVTVLRYFNTYGPRATSTQYGGVVPKFIAAALKDKPITVYGDGSQTRCFTFVDDNVTGTMLSLDRKVDHHVLNIGNDHSISINQLAVKIKEMTGSQSTIIHVPYEKAYGIGYEDTPNRMPDLTKTKKLLNYVPTIGIDEGLKRTIEWYRAGITWPREE
ncbi:NAD-dependent epimerase/dehydratase family protein [Neobacillus mesonae]|uniref:NAD-dependent epimerase/dehydratase family protein n=1 Tax=Neobacillus mesonae TaxID=1193713 RepID=UPI002E1D97FE|nr:NAD-dependent epimerase/dehydratase family protein [Neobacillus mesonae]MED4207560.1 NAD-dependent epimerase/dehydratase family protein [Neobacillus mesonae]